MMPITRVSTFFYHFLCFRSAQILYITLILNTITTSPRTDPRGTLSLNNTLSLLVCGSPIKRKRTARKYTDRYQLYPDRYLTS